MIALALLAAPWSLHAQGQSEIDTIALLGKELIAQRKAEAKAAAEAAHQARLEEQSKLKRAYQAYLGHARRTAMSLIDKKRKAVQQEKVDLARRKAIIIVEEVTKATQQRVRNELDPLYNELEKAIGLTADELHAANPKLKQLHGQLSKTVGQKLDWVDQTAILYALCHNTREQEIIADNVKLREKLSDDEAASIDLTNRRRLVLGLRPLKIDFALVACGRDHSKDMRTKGFFSHTSPVQGKKTPWDRAKNFGTSANGENIAHGQKDGTAVTMAWWYSPGHLKNLMGKSFKRIGVGQDKKHYTQLFGG